MGDFGREQYVEFGIGEERYALPIGDIQEIIRMQPITRIPGGSDYVKGVLSLRGKVMPVLSLARLFGLNREEALTKAARIMILRLEGEACGLIVDRVNKVTHFDVIQPPPENIGTETETWLTGIGLSPGGMVGILEPKCILKELS